MMVEQMLKDSKFEGGPFLCSWRQQTLKALTCPLHRKRCLKTTFLLKTSLQRALKGVFVQARVSQPRRCHLSVDAYVQEPNQDTAGQLIEQYPGSDTGAGRRNLCSMLPSSGEWRRPGTRAVPCCCRGSLDDNYLLYFVLM